MRRSNRGFTLLEVVVALAILALALMAIFDLNSGAVANHVYTKRLTVASLLARSKMTDLEQDLYDEGFNNDDEEEAGDFSEEGWPQFKWRARIIAPKLDGVTPDQLIGALFNLPIGGDGSDPMSALGGLLGGGGGGKDAAAAAGGAAGASPMAGAAMGMAQPMFTQMVQQLTETVREVHLTVFWQEGTQVESIDLVTHVVSLGPGSDRNGGFRANQGNQPAAGQNQWVNPQTGLIVPNPIPGPDGVMLDPTTRLPLVRKDQWDQQRSNPGSGGIVPGAGGSNPGGTFAPGAGGVKPIFPNIPGFGRPRSQGTGGPREAQ